MINFKTILSTVVLAGALFYIPFHYYNDLAGEKPTVQYDDYVKEKNRAENFDPELTALYEKASTNPKDVDGWKILANEISVKLSEMDTPAQGLVFELIDALQHVLEIDPNDSEALLSMGNVSYNFQVFDKAAYYFSKYLDQHKDDLTTRATYASTLSFIGDFQDAEKELLYVIAKDPKSFLPRANLAINYALAGSKAEAKSAALEAVKYAPDSETKIKFDKFLLDLMNPKEAPQQVAPKEIGKTDSSLQNLSDYVKSNPVAGPKFITAKPNGEFIELHFANFPMKAMPPVAKEKFFSGLKQQVQKDKLEEKYKALVFIDHATAEKMDELSLR